MMNSPVVRFVATVAAIPLLAVVVFGSATVLIRFVLAALGYPY